MYSVAVQLKTLIADGIATTKLRNENTNAAYIDWPLVNMWWPQTRNPNSAIARLEIGDELVAEDALAGEAGDDLADHAHARQDHDVDRRVRVEPEEVLEEDRIAAERRVENADVEGTLERHQQDRHRDHRRAEDHDEAGGVERPDEERQPEPGQARRAHLVDGDDEVEARQDRREPGDEDADRRRNHSADRGLRAVRRVEGPAGVDAAREHRPHRERGAQHVDVPAEQVDPREREVARPDHQRNEEVPQHRRNRRDQEEEHHHDAVHREQLVVGVRLHQVACGRQQLEANRNGEETADHEHDGDRHQVEERDALVVGRQQPRLHAVVDVQVVDRLGRFRVHFPSPVATAPWAPSDLMYARSCSTSSSLRSP